MNRDEFLEFCKSPNNVSFGQSQGLKEIISRYPFFQAARALFTLAQKEGNSIGYTDALRSTALFTTNRRRLYNLLEWEQIPKQTSAKASEIQVSESIESPLQEDEPTSQSISIDEDSLINDIISYPELPPKAASPLEPNNSVKVELEQKPVEEIENEESRSFISWLSQFKKGDKKVISDKLHEPKKSREEIIDQFIQTEPRISPPEKKEFYSPIGMAKKSVIDSEEIVSETLADIFAKQGNVEKAIRIYKKLSLLNPDKSSYFAALIKKLENPDTL